MKHTRYFKAFCLVLLASLSGVSLSANNPVDDASQEVRATRTNDKRIKLSKHEVEAFATTDSALVLLSKPAARLISRLARANSASQALRNCKATLAKTNRMVPSDDLAQAVFEIEAASEQDLVELQNLLGSLEPHGVRLAQDGEVTDLYIDATAKLNARSAKPYQTVSASLVPPRKCIMHGNRFITGELCVKGDITAFSDVCVHGKVQVDLIEAKTGDTVTVTDDLCVTGTIFADAIICKEDDGFDLSCSLSVDGDICLTGTVRGDALESKTSGTIDVLSNLCIDDRMTLSVNKIDPKSGIEIKVLSQVDPAGSSRLEIARGIDSHTTSIGLLGGDLGQRIQLGTQSTGRPEIHVGNMSTGDQPRIHIGNGATNGGRLQAFGSENDGVIVDGQLGVCIESNLTLSTDRICAKTDGGAIEFCSSICLAEGTTFSVDTMAPKFSTEVTITGGDLCLTQTLRTDAIDCKDNDVIKFLCDRGDFGTQSANDQLYRFGTASTGNTSVFIGTGKTGFVTNVAIGSTLAGGQANLVIDGGTGKNALLDVDGDVCVTGTVETDAIDCKDNDAIVVNCDVCFDTAMGLTVNEIHPKTDGLLTVDGDLCVTQTLRTDALDCKDNDFLEMSCTLSVSDLCVTGTIEANAITCKENDPIIFDCNSIQLANTILTEQDLIDLLAMLP